VKVGMEGMGDVVDETSEKTRRLLEYLLDYLHLLHLSILIFHLGE